MSDKSPSEMLRDDENIRNAGEKIVDLFKYFAGVSWTPIIVVLAFFKSGETEIGLFGKLLVTSSLVALMAAGAIFFLAYQKQTLMIAHALMGDEAIDMAMEVNPNARAEIERTKYVAWRLGHIADKVAFPLMTISYVFLALAAVLAVWL